VRYTSTYQSGIESVDREYRIMIGVLGHKDKMDDDGDIIFLKQGTDVNDFEIICRCASAVSRSVYELVALSIQDDRSVTETQLYSAIKMLAKKCSMLWSEGKPDPDIEKYF